MRAISFQAVCTILAGFLCLLGHSAAAEPDPLMGLYEGFWTTPNGGPNGRVTVQVRPLGGKKYDGFLTLHRAKAMTAALQLKMEGNVDGGVRMTGTPAGGAGGDLLPMIEAEAEVTQGKVTGKIRGEIGSGTFEASLVTKKSPTLGAAPPKGAIVLFDGKDTGRWEKPLPWQITPEGAMRVTSGDIYARDPLVNYKLHLEFRTPYMPEALGQARGNSGVYLQNRFEVQILDSFGLFPLQQNDCGAIYNVIAPSVNACLPPLQWQTYDITYVEGIASRKESPRITVELNGVKILDRIRPGQNSPVSKGTEDHKGFLRLQDHGNPVEFRNIWAEPFYSVLRMRGE